MEARLEAHKEEERQLKERLKKSLEDGPRIVIDLDWESRMMDNDVRHLVQQLSFSYAANKSVSRPCHMLLTSFKGGIAATANRMISGMDKWYVTRTEAHYSELFASPEERSSLVYLTADAEEELGELDERKVYIVGGLVDHNRYKGLCQESARAAGIATARLPISRHIQLASRAVLTVNHVFQILVEYFNRRDWAAVLDAVLPMRKRAEYQQQQQGGLGKAARRKAGQGKGQAAAEGEDGGEGEGEGDAAGAGADAAEAGDAAGAGRGSGSGAPAEGAAEAAAEAGEGQPAVGAEGGSEGAEAAAEAASAGDDDGQGRGTKRKADSEAAAQ
ncbi:hypothetical protein GPECTOR_61g784 [Gonium pectorale]|uniref:tRNA (guanine(9)-N(1))-methyltransferase n=1 Tax=Gonium pectorale TaxID=33097 RepID=A0A150G4T3_GONPE|nr:hypothetical protein GPECTOR_61g784 [Gonium pectorale]|eukprot:KXZ44831.1 hypothetical protein GPECTOR_61g784 [Gonium pectorale]